MTEYIDIPSGEGLRRAQMSQATSSPSSASFASSSASPTLSSSSSSSPSSAHDPSCGAASASPLPFRRSHHQGRPSLLGSTISHQEHTVINVGHPDGPPRLITCVKASQGFDWNQDIFLPSYGEYDSSELERKQDPVHEIVLTEAEVQELFPQ